MAVGLEKLLAFEGNVEEVYDRNFQIEYEYWGEYRTYDLKPNAAEIMLTNENRQGSSMPKFLTFLEYVDLYVKYLLVDSVAKQFDSFMQGFRTVCDSEGFRVC